MSCLPEKALSRLFVPRLFVPRLVVPQLWGGYDE